MKETRILGVYLENRVAEAGEVQGILTKYGCSIKTRLGLHEADADRCSSHGLILLELAGDAAEWDKLEKDLAACKGVRVGKMSFPAV